MTPDTVVARVWAVWSLTFLFSIGFLVLIVSTEWDDRALLLTQLTLTAAGLGYVFTTIIKDIRSWR